MANHGWLWKGRRGYLFDGTTITMPDTPENQEAYPQVYNQKLVPNPALAASRSC
jgi:hypothetical protein